MFCIVLLYLHVDANSWMCPALADLGKDFPCKIPDWEHTPCFACPYLQNDFVATATKQKNRIGNWDTSPWK